MSKQYVFELKTNEEGELIKDENGNVQIERCVEEYKPSLPRRVKDKIKAFGNKHPKLVRGAKIAGGAIASLGLIALGGALGSGAGANVDAALPEGGVDTPDIPDIPDIPDVPIDPIIE